MVAYANLDWQNAILERDHKLAFMDLKSMWLSRMLGRIFRAEEPRRRWNGTRLVVDRPYPYDARDMSNEYEGQAAYKRADLDGQIKMIEARAWGRIKAAERMLPRLTRNRPMLELWHANDAR